MRTLSIALLPAAAFLLIFAPVQAQRDLAGAADIQLRLEKLNVVGSVLMIAAHPDDENTALLAYFARGRKLRTAYLSATRGEGGQNEIGPELGDALGVLRAGEVCALAKVKGASARIAVAINDTVDFMRTLSLFRLRRGSSRTVRRPHRSQCASIRVLLGEAICLVFPVSTRILDPMSSVLSELPLSGSKSSGRGCRASSRI